MSVLLQAPIRYFDIPDGSGCSLTSLDVVPETYEQWLARGYTQDWNHIWADRAEIGLLGLRAPLLSDVFRSRVKQANKPSRTVDRDTQYVPFITRRQREIINSEYFMVEDAAFAEGAEFTNEHPGAVAITLNGGTGDWKTNVSALEKSFRPRHFLIVEGTRADGSLFTLQYQILRAVNADTDTTKKCIVYAVPSVGAAAWSYLSTEEKAQYLPPNGLAVTAANDVNDWESHCVNGRSDINASYVRFWLQTRRTSMITNDEFEKVVKDAKNINQFMAEYGVLPYAERQRQQRLQDEREWINTIMFGQPLMPEFYTDTGDEWLNLEPVGDIEFDDCAYDRVSQTEGIEYQLVKRGRYHDLAGAELNLDSLQATLLRLARTRENDMSNNGFPVRRLTGLTDPKTLHFWRLAFHKFEKQTWGEQYTRQWDPNQLIEFKKRTNYDAEIFYLPEINLEVELIAEPLYEAKKDLFRGDSKAKVSRGNRIDFWDFSDIDISVTQTNSKSNVYPGDKIGEYNKLYSCVMNVNKRRYSLRSETFAVCVKNPYRHFSLVNFAEACPILSPRSCPESYD